MPRFIRLGGRTLKKITSSLFCVNQMALKLKFRILFLTKFSKLRNWISSVVMSMRGTTCMASFVKVGSGIRKLIWAGADTQIGI
jgi:hypothetical protein